MTVKELKEKLNQLPDDLIVMIPNINWWHPFKSEPQDIPAKHVTMDCNEVNGCVFIDSYEERPYDHIWDMYVDEFDDYKDIENEV